LPWSPFESCSSEPEEEPFIGPEEENHIDNILYGDLPDEAPWPGYFRHNKTHETESERGEWSKEKIGILKKARLKAQEEKKKNEQKLTGKRKRDSEWYSRKA
jgi:hypothetical protein